MRSKKGYIASILMILSASLCLIAAIQSRARADVDERVLYFDPHNHLNGILPYEAYANLPSYIEQLEAGKQPVIATADKRKLYGYMQTWYGQNKAKFGNKPFSPDFRYGLGGRATLQIYSDSPDTVDGALERTLTATPYTEYDSAYAVRGNPVEPYLKEIYHDDKTMADNLCTATVLDLARTGITLSEQSLNFIGGWKFDKDKYSARLKNVLCYQQRPGELDEKGVFTRMDKPKPTIRILLMTASAELGQVNGGKSYRSFAANGECQDVALSDGAKTSPAVIHNALLAEDADGKLVVPKEDQMQFFGTVVGIDTAGPEVTCFSQDGMEHYRQLVESVYQAAKARRALDWHGKLLVHTHAGEGFTVYYGKTQLPIDAWSFDNIFGADLPDVSRNQVTNPLQAQKNIGALLDAIRAEELKHKDLHDYLVFRIGHATWASEEQAEQMYEEQVEADVNLDSNIATNAYPLSYMPASAAIKERVKDVIGNQTSNLSLNDFPHFVIPDASDVENTGEVLGNSSLKYLLMHHVRMMLGTDGAGIEYSDIAREYQLGKSLIGYWDEHDPLFKEEVGDLTEQYYFDNVNWHLKNMSTDGYLSYR